MVLPTGAIFFIPLHVRGHNFSDHSKKFKGKIKQLPWWQCFISPGIAIGNVDTQVETVESQFIITGGVGSVSPKGTSRWHYFSMQPM